MLPNLTEKTVELSRTPLVLQKDTGRWSLFLIEGKEIEWGHRFDAGIGYRVYLKFKDAWVANVFLPEQARKAAVQMSKRETNEDILNLGIALKRMAADVDALNRAWAAAGCPDQPLDKVMEAGNA